MDIQIIHDQHNFFTAAIMGLHQLAQELGEPRKVCVKENKRRSFSQESEQETNLIERMYNNGTDTEGNAESIRGQPEVQQHHRDYGRDERDVPGRIAAGDGKRAGYRIARPSKTIRVFDCSCRFGRGVCVGSEISGGVEDVKIWDCDLTRSLFGLQIKGTKKRGGYVRDIEVTDCTLPRVSVHAVSYNDDGVPADSPPVFQGFRFERLRFTGRALDHAGAWGEVPPIELVGFDVPGYEMRDVTVRGCVLPSDGQPVILRHCANISMERLDCNAEHQPDISANGKEQEYGTNGH